MIEELESELNDKEVNIKKLKDNNKNLENIVKIKDREIEKIKINYDKEIKELDEELKKEYDEFNKELKELNKEIQELKKK